MERRERFLDLLKTPWFQVSDLRAQSAQESFNASEITGKIRAVCEDVDHKASFQVPSVISSIVTDAAGNR